MGEQHRLVKAHAARRRAPLHRNARQRLQPRVVMRERHKRGPRLGHGQPELRGNPIGQTRRAHLRDRLAARGKNKVIRPHRDRLSIARQRHDKAARVAPHITDFRFTPKRCPRRFKFRNKHLDDLNRLAVAEQLPQCLLVPGDPVPLNQIKKVPLGIAAERRFREMRVARQKRLRVASEICEIAPTAPRNADLFARPFRVIHHQNIAPGMRRAHHASRPSPQNQRPDLLFHAKSPDLPAVGPMFFWPRALSRGTLCLRPGQPGDERQ